MKEDATAKELESLLQDALKSGLEKPRGDVPLLQLKTVPLDVQSLPRPTPARVVESAPKSEGGPRLAEKLAPDSARPQGTKATKATNERSRTSKFAVGMLGLMAVAAAGGAFWFSQQRQVASSASVALNSATPANAPASSEGAIQITISRPTPPAPEAAPTPPPPSTESSTPPLKAEPAAPPKTEEPKPAAAVAAKPAPAAETKVDAKTKHVAAAPPAAAPPAPKAEPKPVVAKKEDSKPAEKPPTPTPAVGGGSVDALLQQQLKGAIP